MKLLLLIGALLGFGIGLTFSWMQENAWPSCLWHACAAAYATALLLRWWGRAWRKNLAESFEERRAASTGNRVSNAAKS